MKDISPIIKSEAIRKETFKAHSRNSDSILWLLALVNFLVGLSAFLVVGLISPIQTTLGISVSQAGHLVSFYAIAYAIGSPLGMAVTCKYDRKTVLVGCMALFTVSAAFVAAASSFHMLLFARVLSALAAGLITPVTASIAVNLSTPDNMGRKLARVFLGFTLAQALGIPIGSIVGHSYGWETAFYGIFTCSFLVTGLLVISMQRKICTTVNDFRALTEALSNTKELISVLCTTTFIAGIYTLYTYIEPLVIQSYKFAQGEFAVLLFVFGCGAVIGNHLGGQFNDKLGSTRTLCILCLLQFILMPLFSYSHTSLPVLLLLTFAWSVFGWSFMVAQQSRLVQQSPSKQGVLLALNAAAIYVGAAIGSALGGVIINIADIGVLGLAGGMISLLAFAHILFSERLRQSR